MKKRLIALLLVCSMMFGLVACGGGKEPNNTTGQTQEEEIPEKPDYTITISAAVSCTGDAYATLQKAAEDFNASQSDYKIDMYYGGAYGDLFTVIQTSTPNNIPDIYMISGNGSGMILSQPQYYVPVQK
ncbi:MAG: hypothetical protein IJZ53_06090, partial [Tyzzerella sp.]|nr:hypothetical protein [Tyzzerella sp.]